MFLVIFNHFNQNKLSQVCLGKTIGFFYTKTIFVQCLIWIKIWQKLVKKTNIKTWFCGSVLIIFIFTFFVLLITYKFFITHILIFIINFIHDFFNSIFLKMWLECFPQWALMCFHFKRKVKTHYTRPKLATQSPFLESKFSDF